MIVMGLDNTDFEHQPRSGLEKPTGSGLKAEPEGDTGEWPVIHPGTNPVHALSTQEITRKLIDACLQLNISLVTFDSSKLGKNGEISPRYMESLLEAAFKLKCPHIIIDFSRARSFEETSENDAAGFLLKALRHAFQSKIKIIICDVSPTIDARLRALHIEPLFSRAESVEGAIASIKLTSPPPTPSGHP